MKTCVNCYYYDKCGEEDKAHGCCEYYDSIYDNGETVRKEYEESLTERVETYQEIVDELNS